MASNTKPSLYVKARHLGYKRAQRNQDPSCSLVQIENVNSQVDAKWYLGKRIAYVYSGKNKDSKGNKTRIIWGKITRIHGNSGTVRAKFTSNLPPASFGSGLRVMLYPSNI